MQWFNIIATEIFHSLTTTKTPVVHLLQPRQRQPATVRPQKSTENYTRLRTAAKASKSLLVGLNLFYTEGSLQGFTDQKVENYCMMGGSTDPRSTPGMLGGWLDWMILKISSNLDDSMMLQEMCPTSLY